MHLERETGAPFKGRPLAAHATQAALRDLGTEGDNRRLLAMAREQHKLLRGWSRGDGRGR